MKSLPFACLAAAALPCIGTIEAFAQTLPPASASPNVIIILADDIGYGELSCYGERRYQTPNIDALAREGLSFTDFYAGGPECAPSRCCLMTGVHPGHGRIRANFSYAGTGSARRIGLQAADTTVAELLKGRGYATACIGKWGLGEEGTPGAPWDKGFDTFYGFVNQTHAHNYYPEFIYDGRDKIALPANYGFAHGDYISDHFTARTLDYLDRHRNGPFFLYLAYTLPHGQLTAPDDAILREPLDLSDGYPASKVTGSSPVFAAMVRRLDRDVGTVMARLKELGIDRNTLVFFTSDNGPAHAGPTPEDTVDVDFFRGSGPLRGEKSDVYEGGIRIPCIARWPGRIAPGRTSRTPLAFWDFLPTLVEAAGGTAPKNIDGISFLPDLLGQAQPEHPYLYWEFISKGQPRVAVRAGRWKLDRYGPDAPFQLYDLETDLGESHDVAASNPEVLGRLVAMAKEAHVDSPDFSLRGGGRRGAPQPASAPAAEPQAAPIH